MILPLADFLSTFRSHGRVGNASLPFFRQALMKPVRGFTLPAVLVVTAALLILAVGMLLVASVERGTARSFVDRQRAQLAVDAGLENIRSILTREAANDDFIILQSNLANSGAAGRDPTPQLLLARGRAAGDGYAYRYVPLFSTTGLPPESSQLAPPPVDPLLGASDLAKIDFTTLPYQDKVRAAWLPVQDENGRTVARYAYWVEDLQARIDPAFAGNADGSASNHVREPYPFVRRVWMTRRPAPAINPP